MAQGVSTGDVHLETVNCCVDLTDLLRNIKEEEDANKIEMDDEEATSAEDLFPEELLGALERKNALEVWELVKKNHSIISKSSLYQDIANLEENSSKSSIYSFSPRRKSRGKVRSDTEDDRKNNARKRKWIKILSNPLFIGVEWLWRTEANCNTSKNEDVIEGALNDAYLLEKIASNEHRYERGVYESSAEAYETFATNVLEESTLNEFYEIMNVEGDDFVLDERPGRVTKLKGSLSLLKIAANMRRKKFVTGPRCQFILNLVTFEGWPDWKSKSLVEKIIRWFVHFLLSTIIVPIYIPLCLFGKVYPSKFHSASGFSSNNRYQRGVEEFFEWVRSLYESPFSNFVNHTMSYILLLCLLFSSTMGNEFEYYSETGLHRLDYDVLVFVIGLSLRDFLAACKQGASFYFSKWWNVMHAVTFSTFLMSYSVWLIAWEIYGEWKPRKNIFTVADVLYATATVMAFIHFTYVFQASSTFGPLQLSLYRMVKDVLRFLVIFFMLFLAFAAGLVKVYAYYVSSQMKLSRELGNSTYAKDHPYANHDLTTFGLIWMLFGNVDDDKISVDDPSFYLISVFGRIFVIAYVVCVSIVALNMLIAMMNNSYERIMMDADLEWKFSSTLIWLDYMNKGNSIPVPFNLVYYSLLLFYIPFQWFRECGKKEKQSHYREKRIQAMKFSVGRYLKKNFLSGDFSERTTALKRSMNSQPNNKMILYTSV